MQNPKQSGSSEAICFFELKDQWDAVYNASPLPVLVRRLRARPEYAILDPGINGNCR